MKPKIFISNSSTAKIKVHQIPEDTAIAIEQHAKQEVLNNEVIKNVLRRLAAE
ncbi:MAG: hypothetical protein M3Z88_07305 [Bombilactobacillus mellifer]|uniref:hypothetical protein n=1 Tax=Bombilactobacillus mellifer TaxID=1218492 RepID=UPI0023F0A5B2|nr:hypothetical protein [Bombilactobacillus mellifer]MCT6844600.1 hypothetical protein [Bombilactobacillus mellifer]